MSNHGPNHLGYVFSKMSNISVHIRYISTALDMNNAFFANHGDVVAHTAELTVMGYATGEGFRLVSDQLDVKASFAVTFVDEVLQLLYFLRLNGLFGVLPHAMPGTDGFFECHRPWL